MIVLGFILIVLAAGAVLFALIATGTLTAAPLSAIGVTVSVTPLAMFVAGAVLHSLDERSLELPKLRQHPGMMMLYRNEGTLLGSRVLLPYLMHDFSPVF